MPRPTVLMRSRIVFAIGTAACAAAALTACAPETGAGSRPAGATSSESTQESAQPRVSTDPIDHEPPADLMESGTGLSVVSLADADTAGTRDPSPWKAGDPLPDYLQQALSHEAAVVEPASLSRLAATRGVEVWIGAGSGQLAGQTCIVAAQSQLPVAGTSCAAPAEFEANGASALLRLPNGSQAIEARVLPERAKGTGVAGDTWEAVNDRILLLAKPPTADAGELRVPTRDGSATIVVRPMG